MLKDGNSFYVLDTKGARNEKQTGNMTTQQKQQFERNYQYYLILVPDTLGRDNRF